MIWSRALHKNYLVVQGEIESNEYEPTEPAGVKANLAEAF